MLGGGHDGRELAPKHGWPSGSSSRGLWWKSVKWVRSFELVAADTRGLWEVRGYPRADPCSRRATVPGSIAARPSVRVLDRSLADEAAGTGCTVVLPLGNVASATCAGNSPGSRELASLEPSRRLNEIHGCCSPGKRVRSAAADGVSRGLGRGVGYQTPIATTHRPAAVVFDLGASVGREAGPAEGRAACDDAREGRRGGGSVGAGTGATAASGRDERPLAGGLGIASAEESGRACGPAVVNPIGSVELDAPSSPGRRPPNRRWSCADDGYPTRREHRLVVVATEAKSTNATCTSWPGAAPTASHPPSARRTPVTTGTSPSR